MKLFFIITMMMMVVVAVDAEDASGETFTVEFTCPPNHKHIMSSGTSTIKCWIDDRRDKEKNNWNDECKIVNDEGVYMKASGSCTARDICCHKGFLSKDEDTCCACDEIPHKDNNSCCKSIVLEESNINSDGLINIENIDGSVFYVDKIDEEEYVLGCCDKDKIGRCASEHNLSDSRLQNLCKGNLLCQAATAQGQHIHLCCEDPNDFNAKDCNCNGTSPPTDEDCCKCGEELKSGICAPCGLGRYSSGGKNAQCESCNADDNKICPSDKNCVQSQCPDHTKRVDQGADYWTKQKTNNVYCMMDLSDVPEPYANCKPGKTAYEYCMDQSKTKEQEKKCKDPEKCEFTPTLNYPVNWKEDSSISNEVFVNCLAPHTTCSKPIPCYCVAEEHENSTLKQCRPIGLTSRNLEEEDSLPFAFQALRG